MMTINKKALYLFENNRYAEAFQLFKEAVKEERNVQSLNNLAWIYLNEEENLNKAKELLETTEYSMKEICSMVGYSDPNYFSRSFKKNVGVTPTEFKEGKIEE